MKHDPDLYNDVVSRFFTDDVIKRVQTPIERPTASTINLTHEIELDRDMFEFALQYTGLERKQQYSQEEEVKLSEIYNILDDERSKIVIEDAIQRLENSSPEFKEQFPGYKSTIERYQSILKGIFES